ncbi:MAG: hypothetical protein H0T47_13025 [Planctomycetaceae bacterium]|nr:hypothetical protein [Planctomycetaceae bacterium]
MAAILDSPASAVQSFRSRRIQRAEDLLSLSDEELTAVDPLVMNLLVAKGIPSQANLDIERYRRMADQWATDIARRLPELEREFHATPQEWNNDLDFFRLGIICWYCDLILKVAYREDQREAKVVFYTDPTDLFLNGVMDTRRGTCGNLSVLHVVLGRRLGWPVSLACVGSHFVCRFDDGTKIINIETTDTGRGGFATPTDEELMRKKRLPAKAAACGSDLRAVTPREMLGLFFGLRARHYDNTERFSEAERDYLLARYLFPQCRDLYFGQNQISVQVSMDLFEPGERGHPTELACWLQDVVRLAPWKRKHSQSEEPDADDLDALFGQFTTDDLEKC